MGKKHIMAVAAVLAAISFAEGAVPMRDPDVGGLAPYSYPENRAKEVTAVWMPDGKAYVAASADGKRIEALDPASGRVTETLIDLTNTRETVIPDFEGFTLSPDASKILLWRDSKMIFRRSFTAVYYVYERRSRLLKPLSTKHGRQRDPLFSPDSRMVAFAATDGNIYCAKLDYGSEVAVTTDGDGVNITNGAADWSYEEEFTTTALMAFAPDNLTFCYVRFNQTDIPDYTLPVYQGTCEPQDQYALYPGIQTFRYPVAGGNICKVSLHSYDVETRKTKDIALPGNPDYIPRILYGPDAAKLVVATLNRPQNHFELFVVNPKSTVSRSIFDRHTDAWIIPEAYEGLKAEADAVAVADDASGYVRWERYSYTGTPAGTAKCEGHDLTDYYGRDALGRLYYQAAAPTPMDRTVRVTDARGITKVLGPENGSTSADIAPGCRNMLLCHSDIATPPTYSFNNSDGRELRVYEDNAVYAASRREHKARREFMTLNVNGRELNAYIVRPEGFSDATRYPVIMSQYSGPGSQSVLNKWTYDWEDYFASKGYIIVCVDGRGTAGRGTEFRTCVYRQLGVLETEDQVAAAREVGRLPYVDSSRIGIYGWSYGGYETLMAASADNCPFAAAVAVAPVTDWRYYDNIYTERYMDTPQANERGYRDASAIGRALQLGCPLLMMYGTSDDNVHPANTLQYVSTLQSAGIMADMFVFPNMNHSINGCNARSVVYARMLRFFDSKLK